MVTGVNQDWRTEVNVTLILKQEDHINAWNKRVIEYDEWQPSYLVSPKSEKIRKGRIKIRSKSKFRHTPAPGSWEDI